VILNLGEVCSLATTLSGGRADWTLSEASRWANFGLEQVAVAAGAHHKPREGLAISSTTSGGNRIALPTDFDYPIAFTLYQGSSSTATTSRTTNEVPLAQRDAAYLDAQSGQFLGGIPEYYAWYSTWLELFPSPNSAYSLQLRYGARQPTLIASTETPDIDAKWHQAWLYKTAELLAASRNDVENETLGRARYLAYVNTIETDKALSQHDRRSMSLRFGGARSSKNGRLD
jgi:hypothetical protein